MILNSKILFIIHAKSVFYIERTGIEEYSYNLIRNWMELLNKDNKKYKNCTFFLFVQQNIKHKDLEKFFKVKIIPDNFKIKVINLKRLWTLYGLSLAILKILIHNFFSKKYDRIILFCPAHNFPLIMPKERIVTIHGLEYERARFCYSFFRRLYLRCATRFSLIFASKVIAVSNTTKDDMEKIYNAEDKKIKVIYHGIDRNRLNFVGESKKYVTFIGRIEIKKNLINLINAFKLLLKENKNFRKYKLFIAGPQGFGFKKIYKCARRNKHFVNFLPRFLTYKEKLGILRDTKVFYFASFYEGFGMPIIEMQNFGIPVITANLGGTREIAGKGAIFVDPQDIEDIKEKMNKFLKNKEKGDELLHLGNENLRRFKGWEEVSRLTLDFILE